MFCATRHNYESCANFSLAKTQEQNPYDQGDVYLVNGFPNKLASKPLHGTKMGLALLCMLARMRVCMLNGNSIRLVKFRTCSIANGSLESLIMGLG